MGDPGSLQASMRVVWPVLRVGRFSTSTAIGGGGRVAPALLWSLQQPLSSAADVGFPGDRGCGGSAWWGQAHRRACAAGVAPPPDKISPEA